jgi:hypothetical protein
MPLRVVGVAATLESVAPSGAGCQSLSGWYAPAAQMKDSFGRVTDPRGSARVRGEDHPPFQVVVPHPRRPPRRGRYG